MLHKHSPLFSGNFITFVTKLTRNQSSVSIKIPSRKTKEKPLVFPTLTVTSEFFASRRLSDPARRFAHYFATKLAAFCPGLGTTEQRERWSMMKRKRAKKRVSESEWVSEREWERERERENEGPEERRYPPGWIWCK